MVYLIHFDEKFGHAQHYVGYSAEKNYAKRIEHHRNGTGASILRAVNKAGINWSVVKEWPNEDGNFERTLKNLKGIGKAMCPVCRLAAGLPEVPKQYKKKPSTT